MGVEREEEEENVCVYVSMYRPQERMQCCMYSLMKNFAFVRLCPGPQWLLGTVLRLSVT